MKFRCKFFCLKSHVSYLTSNLLIFTSTMNKRYPVLIKSKRYLYILACIFSLLLISLQSKAQYFGQNKVRYKNLKFKVFRTPHFQIYYYLQNDSMIKRFAQESELWYTLHQQVFRDTFKSPNPIILYANHPDFQQTTAIEGDIDVGTGGVTEGLKNRVVMPVMETNQTTRHVIGHELVHAFQYHLLLGKDSAAYENINNLPLWMIEGMAEYLSLGKNDSYTAMWMRDAYLNHDIPSVRDLTLTNKYFPYRYGEAFWSFIGSTYGDTVIVPFFKNAARFGLEYGIKRTFGYDDKTLSKLWKNAVENTYKPYLKDTLQVPVGHKLIDDKNSGKMNLAPAVSPDGKYLAFLSEKNLFTVDLFLADAKTGHIIRKLTSKISSTHIDEFNFIESAGTWSPDSKKFAFSVFNKGRNRMLVVDVATGHILDDVSMGKAEQFSNLSWSPDGKNIVFQGLANGQGDLYMYNFDSKQVTQLTNDKYSDYQPSFSRDGKKIVFSSDRTTYDRSLSQDITFNLAELDLATGKITDIKVFNGANNLNPQYSSDGTQIWFLSNRDGFRNIYRYTIATGKIEQMTDLFTGVCGITEYSPALSISANNDIVYSYYRAQKYALYDAKASDFTPKTVDDGIVKNSTAGILPPARSVGVDLINSNLNNFLAYPKIPFDSVKTVPYKPLFKLDYVASSGVGASVSQFGAGLAGGIQGVFSDILGRNQIYAGVAINGEIYDFGAQFTYIKQTNRWNFGVSVSHIPFQTANYSVVPTTFGSSKTPAVAENFDLIRVFQDQVSLFTSYPITKKTRVEFGTGGATYYYRVDRYTTVYDTLGNELSYTHTHIPNSVFNGETNQNNGLILTPFTLFNVNTALVGDNSFFGVASPLSGYRYRLQAEYDFGTYRFFAPTIDMRGYLRADPVTFASRLYFYGRFGNTGNLYEEYLGYPFLIRGYEAQTFNAGKIPTNGFTIDQLSGNRIAVVNFEVRLPLTGPERLSQFKSKFLFTELNLFFDAGLAWNAGNQIIFKSGPDVIGRTPNTNLPIYNPNQRVPATSAGLSLRVNMFGAFVLEPYMAFPFNRTDVSKPVFGLGFTPGW